MAFQCVKILENKEVSSGIFSMQIAAEEAANAGQFYMLRGENSNVLLPRAISVCDNQSGQVQFLYQVVGNGTGELSRLRAGDTLCVTGPLGNGFPVESLTGKIALVGGGIGVAPMLLTAKRLLEKGCAVTCLLGYRDEPFLLQEIEKTGAVVQVATESGRTGQKGYVTALLQPQDYDTVLVCGPEPMMKAVTGLCEKAGTDVYVSLENKMACGLGACLVCTCTDKDGKNHRTCKDGPVFRGEEINFDA